MSHSTPQSLTPTDEQVEFRRVLRQFAEEQISPRAAEVDRTATYSWENFDAMKAMELTSLSYPVEFGGAGASTVDQAIVAEELARVCVSTKIGRAHV